MPLGTSKDTLEGSNDHLHLAFQSFCLGFCRELARQLNDGRSQAAAGEASNAAESRVEDLLARLFDVIGLSEAGWVHVQQTGHGVL